MLKNQWIFEWFPCFVPNYFSIDTCFVIMTFTLTLMRNKIFHKPQKKSYTELVTNITSITSYNKTRISSGKSSTQRSVDHPW